MSKQQLDILIPIINTVSIVDHNTDNIIHTHSRVPEHHTVSASTTQCFSTPPNLFFFFFFFFSFSFPVCHHRNIIAPSISHPYPRSPISILSFFFYRKAPLRIYSWRAVDIDIQFTYNTSTFFLSKLVKGSLVLNSTQLNSTQLNSTQLDGDGDGDDDGDGM